MNAATRDYLPETRDARILILGLHDTQRSNGRTGVLAERIELLEQPRFRKDTPSLHTSHIPIGHTGAVHSSAAIRGAATAVFQVRQCVDA